MKRFLRNNSLSIVLLSIFAVCFVALSITGFYDFNETRSLHSQIPLSYGQYLMTGHFGEAVFENWESEFLQMGALVILTIWFVQKGSTDSKKLRGDSEIDTSSRYSIARASTMKQRGKAIRHAIYSNSLTLVLFAIFIFSFVMHALTGVASANEEAVLLGEPTMSLGEYVTGSQFWFESFQNWQSEFLAVGVLIILQVYLRQRGSPESKPVAAPNAKTGT